MQRQTILAAVACAGAWVAFADTYNDWFTGINSSDATALDGLNAENGAWATVPAASESSLYGSVSVASGTITLDLDDDESVSFTPVDSAAPDHNTNTITRVEITAKMEAVSTLPTPSGLAAFCVHAETSDNATVSHYKVWKGGTGDDSWVTLSGTPDSTSSKTLAVYIDYQEGATARRIRFVEVANDSETKLTGTGTDTDGWITLSSTAKGLGSVSCYGSGTLTALNGSVAQYAAIVDGKKYVNASEAATAAGEEGFTPDSTKEYTYTKNGDSYTRTEQPARSEIEKIAPVTGKPLTYSEGLREFLATNIPVAYNGSNSSGDVMTEALATNGVNNLPLWQDYVLGVEPTESVAPIAKTTGDEDSDNITLEIPNVDPPSGTGYSVKYYVGDTEVTDTTAVKIPLSTGEYTIKAVIE